MREPNDVTSRIDVERRQGVGLVRFRDPYILDIPARRQLADAFRDFAADAAIRAIVVSGGRDVFVKGDVQMLADRSPQGVQAIGLHDYWQPIAACPKPVIAALSGLAWGAGCELALMCDILIADRSAQLAQPESRLGVMPGAGGAQRLVRTLGKQMTSYLLLTGRPISAERAWELGLVCELVEAGGVEAAALELAREIAAQPSRSMLRIKQALATGPDLPLAAAIAMDHAEYLLMFDTRDQKEGMAAMIEGRKPSFSGE